jgi:RNA polymerase-binding transcription factor
MANGERKLTKEQLETVRRRLEDERSRILTVLRAPAATAASDGERSEFEEAAQRTAEQNDQLEIRERERALLADVDRALEKLRTGTYGVDEGTGEPIPYERLAVIPWARVRAD